MQPAWANSLPNAPNAFRYRLGPGDRLRMEVFKTEGYQASVEVLSDGTVNLPRLGSVSVWGLSLDEARKRISKGYSLILRRPIVYLDLVGSRPLRVSISGEVQRPGLYSIAQGGSNQLGSAGPTGGATTISTSGWPTLVDAIQKAGGLTAQGDLGNVMIVRADAGPGSKLRTFHYDFWQVLRGSDPVANPLIYDGDAISIARADKLSEADLLSVASSTFAPDTISVNVIGEVMSPGNQSIKANSPLSQALLSAGGLNRRASKTTIKLLRLQSTGAIKQSIISYNPAASLGSPENPPMQQGDTLIVDRHGWAKLNDSLKSAVEPIGPLLNATSIFRLLGGF
ncbi:SLBB domain-containing protein [Cyanobium sp. Morenito 9A2]|nr:SLBB domain-containing protein [Cyanobium sp. Morenito 9A2]